MKIAYVLLYEYWDGTNYASGSLEFAGWTKAEADDALEEARLHKAVKAADEQVSIMELEMPE